MRSARGRVLALLVWPAAVATIYVAAFVLVYVVSVRTMRGRVVSDASLRGALLSGASFQETVDRILDIVSIGSLLGVVATVAVIALIQLDRVRGLAAIGLLVTANVAAQVLKEHVIVRPELGLDEVGPTTLNSLPSGHVTAAFSAVAALLIVLPAAWRVLAAGVGGGFATIVSLATMFAGWHRTADAIAGFLVVGVCTMVAISVVVAYASPRTEPSAGPGLRWWVVASAVAVTLGTAVWAGLSTADALRDSSLGSLLAFSSSGLLILGAAIAVLISMLWVVHATEADTAR